LVYNKARHKPLIDKVNRSCTIEEWQSENSN
jgi:hypothetical protein